MSETTDRRQEAGTPSDSPQPARGTLDPATRDRLLADPGAILADRKVMRALVAAREAQAGANVIDIRARAMQALETRLDRLEATHEDVIAAAFDNQSGTGLIHRAVLGLLDTSGPDGLIAALEPRLAGLLRIETLRLVVEEAPGVPLPAGVVRVPVGMLDAILSAGRRMPRGDDIVLRAAMAATRPLHGRAIASEALLPIDLAPVDLAPVVPGSDDSRSDALASDGSGTDRPRAILLMGSDEAGRFLPAQGTDLLRFFGQVFRLVLIARLCG